MQVRHHARIAFVILLAAVLLSGNCWAAAPAIGEDAWITPVSASAVEAKAKDENHHGNACGYTDAEINQITNVVYGEVGGIGAASVTLTYSDGSKLYTDGYMLRAVHARIVDNQVKSNLFPGSVDGCVRQCWSAAYASTGWRDSSQWRSCREAVVEALAEDIYVPDNVFAATCDPSFASYAPGWYLWARVDWSTGWYAGTFYYYCYG